MNPKAKSEISVFGRIYLTYPVVQHKLLRDMEKIEKSLEKRGIYT